jgi:hypothetical protein
VNPSVLPACDYDPNWCPGIDWNDIKTEDFSANSSPQCHFVTSISQHQPFKNNSAIDFNVNGTPKNNSNCSGNCASGIAKADGGYYIYTPGNDGTYHTSWTNGTKRVDCTPKDPTLPSNSF